MHFLLKVALAVSVASLGVLLPFNGCPPDGEIEVQPSTLAFAACEAGDDPPTQTLTITRRSGNVLRAVGYSVEPDVPWITVTPNEGEIWKSPETITVSVAVDGLGGADSPHTGTITIAAPGATNNPQTVAVTLDLRDRNLWLPYEVIDAEYSKHLDRVVMVSGNPHELHICDAVAKTDTCVDLSLNPMCVSVGPDGRFAAVGHEGLISYVDLASGELVAALPVSCGVGDIVLAGNGYVYAFPVRGQWERIRCVEIATGAEALHTGSSVYQGTRAKLHPDGNDIYGANNGLIPSNAERYSIINGTAEYLFQSRYHGDYAFDGDLWISEQGSKMFTRSGNVFTAGADGQQHDIGYLGSLSQLNRAHCVAHSADAGKLVVLSSSREVQVYEDDHLLFMERLELPSLNVGSTTYPWRGRFVFLNPDASRAYVVAQPDGSSGEAGFGVLVLEDGCTQKPGIVAWPTSLTFLAKQGSNDPNEQAFTIEKACTGMLNWNASSDVPWVTVDPASGQTATGPDEIVVGVRIVGLSAADSPHTGEVTITDPDAVNSPQTVAVTLHLLDTEAQYLPFSVIDAEYSKSLDRIIMVSHNPNRLHMYDPVTEADAVVDLPSRPGPVSVAPDGLSAAVSHFDSVSHVDLASATLIDTLPKSCPTVDLVLAGNGYIYGFPHGDLFTYIRCIEIATRTDHQGPRVLHNHNGRRHPVALAIYTADYGLSYSTLRKYNIANGIAEYLYGSPYSPSEHDFGGNVWISDNGSKIYAASGEVFLSSEDADQDMAYLGSLSELTSVNCAAVDSVTDNVVVLPDSGTEVQRYAHSDLSFKGRTELPGLTMGAQAYPWHGRFVFLNSDAQKSFVVARQWYMPVPEIYGAIVLSEDASRYPVINPSPRDLVFDVIAYGDAPEHHQTISLRNTGVGTLSWSISTDASWVTVEPNSGQTTAETDNVVVSVSVDGLTAEESPYTATVTISDPNALNSPYSVTVTLHMHGAFELPYGVVDAEYSKAMDRIIMVSADPNQLHIYDPLTQTDVPVDLPSTPMCVSVGPDGQYAAVGHEDSVSYVDLATATFSKTLVVTRPVGDVVLAGNGFVYTFPADGEWWARIHCVEIATGTQYFHDGPDIEERNRARLHPGGNAIYTASPYWEEYARKYSIVGGVADFLYGSRYHDGDWFGGDLWITEDGSKIVSRSALVYTSSEIQEQDMFVLGASPHMNTMVWLADSSTAGKMIAISGDDDTQLYVYDNQALSFVENVSIPPLKIGGQTYPWRGRYVFFNADGTWYYVVVQAGGASGLDPGSGVVMLPTP